jgi:TonB family protein
VQFLKGVISIAAFAAVLSAGDPKLLRLDAVPENKILHKAAPVYPPDAIMHRVQGVVKVGLVIAEDGTVSQVRLISGHPLLAPAALQAVKRWRFEPFSPGDDKPAVRVITRVEIPFVLDAYGNPVNRPQAAQVR